MAAQPIIDLGALPLVNNLHASAAAAEHAPRHPLRVVIEDDFTAHLDHQVPPDEMYGTNGYRSGVNAPYAAHCRGMWDEVKSLGPKRVIDIGGNDGTLLAALREASGDDLALVNVDASRSVAEENRAKGIEFVNAYWGDVDVGKADLITSTNVFQHTADVDKFLDGIRRHLDGLWILEFPYFLTSVETNQFDQIYHEHYYYWLVAPLVERFRRHGLTMVSVREVDMHGGSLRIVSTTKPTHDARVWEPFVERERRVDFAQWGASMKEKIALDARAIRDLRERSTVAAFGAAAKGCVWLNATGCQDAFEYVVDDTPQKQGKFVPGTRLEVVSRQRLHDEPPGTIVILAHNFSDHIAESLRATYRGRIVRMIPDLADVALRSLPCCS